MTPLLIAVAIARILSFLILGVVAVRCMYRRRGLMRLSVRQRNALILFASGGIGVALLMIRRLLVWLTNGGESAWWLLYRSPDIQGWIAYSACECFVFFGAIILAIEMRQGGDRNDDSA